VAPQQIIQPLNEAISVTKMDKAIESLDKQLKEVQEHDRMTFLEAASFLMEVNDSKEVGVYIENNGPGPAYLTQLRIYVDGKQLTGTSDIWKTWRSARNGPASRSRSVSRTSSTSAGASIRNPSTPTRRRRKRVRSAAWLPVAGIWPRWPCA